MTPVAPPEHQLAGVRRVSRLSTDHAVFDVGGARLSFGMTRPDLELVLGLPLRDAR